MKSKPILFSDPMVRAILDGRKTQTRRVVKPARKPGFGLVPVATIAEAHQEFWDLCPYGTTGDELWVRETWLADPPRDGTWSDIEFDGCDPKNYALIPLRYKTPQHVLYRAGWNGPDLRWKPSIHMPRWASRITLTITNVRVERLNEISEEDAKAEGCDGKCPVGNVPAYQAGPHSYHFAQLWESINGEGSWQANPWVWVISYERKP